MKFVGRDEHSIRPRPSSLVNTTYTDDWRGSGELQMRISVRSDVNKATGSKAKACQLNPKARPRTTTAGPGQ